MRAGWWTKTEFHRRRSPEREGEPELCLGRSSGLRISLTQRLPGQLSAFRQSDPVACGCGSPRLQRRDRDGFPKTFGHRLPFSSAPAMNMTHRPQTPWQSVP